MAFPTAVNSQITDSVTQSTLNSLGSAPAVAVSSLFQATAHAMALAAHNATLAQQQLLIIAQATTAQGVALITTSTATSGLR